MAIFCFIQQGTVDHRLVKTIGQFVYLTVHENLKCMWDNRDTESIKCGTIGIKPYGGHILDLTPRVLTGVKLGRGYNLVGMRYSWSF